MVVSYLLVVVYGFVLVALVASTCVWLCASKLGCF